MGDTGSINLTVDDGPPARLGVARVSANFLPQLGGGLFLKDSPIMRRGTRPQ
jgi:hypothetical protein